MAAKADSVRRLGRWRAAIIYCSKQQCNMTLLDEKKEGQNDEKLGGVKTQGNKNARNAAAMWFRQWIYCDDKCIQKSRNKMAGGGVVSHYRVIIKSLSQ